MRGRFESLVGRQFGKLTVLERVENNKHGHVQYDCLCFCGGRSVVPAMSLRTGRTKSCGCVMHVQPTRHGMCKTRIHRIWVAMRFRCNNENGNAYSHYGEKGVSVCPDWQSSFESFYEWSLSNGYAEHLTIDRIDNNGNYEPSNCRWVTQSVQVRNTGTFSTNTSGIKGVSFDKSRNKWCAYIDAGNKRLSLGRFNSIDEAAAARKAGELKYWGDNR